MVGMGSVVTRSVPDFHLVLGNPARSVGCVCRCGPLLTRFDSDQAAKTEPQDLTCSECGLKYTLTGMQLTEK